VFKIGLKYRGLFVSRTNPLINTRKHFQVSQELSYTGDQTIALAASTGRYYIKEVIIQLESGILDCELQDENNVSVVKFETFGTGQINITKSLQKELLFEKKIDFFVNAVGAGTAWVGNITLIGEQDG